MATVEEILRRDAEIIVQEVQALDRLNGSIAASLPDGSQLVMKLARLADLRATARSKTIQLLGLDLDLDLEGREDPKRGES